MSTNKTRLCDAKIYDEFGGHLSFQMNSMQLVLFAFFGIAVAVIGLTVQCKIALFSLDSSRSVR